MKKKVAIILGVLVFITAMGLLFTGCNKQEDILSLRKNETIELQEEHGESDTPENKAEESQEELSLSEEEPISQEDSSITEPLISAGVDELIASIEEYGDSSVYATLYELRTIPENPVNPEGEWNRTNVHSGHKGFLSISRVSKEGFQVLGELYYYSHVGDFEETAYYITNDLAIAKYEEDWFKDYDWAPQYVAFFLNGTSIDVKATTNSGKLGFGMNVYIDGEYVQEEPIYTNANVLEEFYSRKDLDALQELLSEDYYTNYFLFSTIEGAVNEYEEQKDNNVMVRRIDA